jgi:integrase
MARANHEGTVYQRKDGRWEAALTYRDAHGNPKRLRVYRKAREEADLALARMKVERDGGVVLGGPNPTLREYLVAWLRDAVVQNVSPKTLEGYEIACRVHILPALGDVRIKDLTARRIQALYAQKRREGLSVASRRKIHGTLKRALRQAVAWGELAASPAEYLDPPTAPPEDNEDSEEIEAFSEEELEQLFQAAEDREDRFRNLYVVAARTGLRQGELLGLRWEDLDLNADPATLMVRRSLAPRIGGGFYMTPLKKKRQRRRVALHHEAAEALQRQRELQQVEAPGFTDRTGLGRDLVFPSTRGTPMFGRNLYNRYYRPTLDHAGLPRLPFHALRHSFASIALFEWRLPVKMVAELLGHSNITLTLNTYGHLLEGSHENEMRRINALFGNARKQA